MERSREHIFNALKILEIFLLNSKKMRKNYLSAQIITDLLVDKSGILETLNFRK